MQNINKPQKDENILVFKGTVTEALSNSMFRVEISESHIVTAIVSGKVRLKKFRVLKGDKVSVEVNKYDITKGRIVFDTNRSPRAYNNSKIRKQRPIRKPRKK